MISKVFPTVIALLVSGSAMAHPIPDTFMALSFADDAITAELTFPLSEYALVQSGDSTTAQIANFLLAHTSVTSPDGSEWTVSVTDVGQDTRTSDDSEYPVITAEMTFTPMGQGTNELTILHDAIIAKVVTDSVIVTDADNPDYVLGVIYVDPATGVIQPLTISR